MPSDESPPPPPVPVKSKPETKPIKALSAAKPLGRAATIEVLVPPAPYSIHQVPRLSNLSLATRPEVPLKRHPTVIPTKTPAFALPPSPVLRPRPLTPIRRGQKKGLFEPPSPPSPSTTDLELDLSLDFSELSLDSEAYTHAHTSAHLNPTQRRSLRSTPPPTHAHANSSLCRHYYAFEIAQAWCPLLFSSAR